MAIRTAFPLSRVAMIVTGIPLGILLYTTWSYQVTSRADECQTWRENITSLMDAVDGAIDRNDEIDRENMATWDRELQKVSSKSDPTKGGVVELWRAAETFRFATLRDTPGTAGERATYYSDRREAKLAEATRILQHALGTFTNVCRDPRSEP